MICPVCAQPQDDRTPGADGVRRCGRCAEPLGRPPGPAADPLAWAITAGCAYVALTLLPLLEVSKLGINRAVRVGGVGASLRAQGDVGLGWFVDACVLYAPLAMVMAIMVLQVAAWRGRAFPGWRSWLAVQAGAARWAMPEVLLLAGLVSLLKIGLLAQAKVGAGSLALAVGAVALLRAGQTFSPAWVRARLEGAEAAAAGARGVPAATRGTPEGRARPVVRGVRSTSLAAALWLAAVITLIPANLLPIMEVSKAGKTVASTIFGGVVQLAGHGSWGIALIVLVASFLVPLGKLAGLAWLLWRARGATGDRGDVRLHRWLDFIGRWSMLDILLVGVLSGLIQFGALAQVRAGSGAPAFAAAVVLTVLAVEAFPLPRLFQRPTDLSPV